MRLTFKNGIPLAAAGLFAVLTGPAVAQKSDTGPSNGPSSAKTSSKAASDARFAQEAATGGKLEVELGRLATQKASNDKVKEFAQRRPMTTERPAMN